MSTVLFRFERHNHDLIKKVEIETDFLPRVGDSINAYDIFDDVKIEPGEDGWFFIVYEINGRSKAYALPQPSISYPL
jgi:hypothetical protein